jgi:hypothetical protein
VAQTIWDEPTTDQAALLGAILAARTEDGTWPTVTQLPPGARAVLDSFPAAETVTGREYRAVWLDDDRVGLTLAAGLLTVDYEIAPYLAMIRTCANRVANSGPVTMTSARFRRRLGADHAFHVRTFPAVLRREPLTADIRTDGDDWEITFGDGFAAYAGVRHLKDYVRKTVDPPAEPETHREYVDPALTSALAGTQHPAKDRLLAIIAELNSNYEAGNPYATLLLHRAITTGNTEVVDMTDVPPPGSLDAVVRAIVERT